MASYEEAAAGEVVQDSVQDIVDNIQNSDISDSMLTVIEEILAANTVTNAEGESVISIATYDASMAEGISAATAPTMLVVPAAADGKAFNDTSVAQFSPIIQMGPNSTVDLTFGGEAVTQAVVLGDGDGNNLVFDTAKDVSVQTAGGANDNIQTGSGADKISFMGSADGSASATVDTGEGNDMVMLSGAGKIDISSGAGDLVVAIDPTVEVYATIDAGDGFDRINITNSRAEHHFRFEDGQFVMNSEGEYTMKKVNVVTYEINGNDIIDQGDQLTVLATTAKESLAAKLYQVALGRPALDAGDDALGGINFWLTQFDPEASVQHTVYSFLNCEEFHNKYDNVSDTAYVHTLFANLNALNSGPAVIEASTLDIQDYVDRLQSGEMNRYDVAWTIAASSETVKILGVDGVNYVIDGDINANDYNPGVPLG